MTDAHFAAIDPLDPHSLVALPLGGLPEEIINTPAFRKLLMVKTLSGRNGVATELQQFKEKGAGVGIRGIDDAIREFEATANDRMVLQALEKVAGLDIASVRQVLIRIYRNDTERLNLIDSCDALRFDRATRKENERWTRRYINSLFAEIFRESSDIKTTGELVLALDDAYSSEDPKRRKVAREHLQILQNKFKLGGEDEIVPFLTDFELLASAVSYYRRYYAEMQPLMREFREDLVRLEATANPFSRGMLSTVNRHLAKTMDHFERFFRTFDDCFEVVIGDVRPNTFKELQATLQRAYSQLGALLCGWGLRLQAWHEYGQTHRNAGAHSRIDMVREYVCKYLYENYPNPEDLDEHIDFLKTHARIAASQKG